MSAGTIQLPSIQKIADSMKMGLLIIDLTNQSQLYLNNSLIRMLGLEKTTAGNKLIDLQQYILEADFNFVENAVADLIKIKSAHDVEFNLSVNEELIYISCDATYLEDEKKVIVFIRDITHAKEHETYIVTYGAKKDSLLEMLGHHLSGTLNISGQVIQHLEKLTKEGKPVSAEAHIGFIKESNRQCIQYINDLLKEEHLISEKIFVKKNRFDVIEKVKAILDEFNHSYPGRLISLTAPKNLFISGDDVKFFQIMNNVIINAIKFTPENKSISVVVEDGDKDFSISVIDEGIGIPDHLKPFVFQKYTPAGRTGLHGEKSIGIGLSIVKRLTELMSGKISFNSQEYKGSTFVLVIPKG